MTINRQEAIDAIYEHEFSNWCDKDEVSTILYGLPSATEWIPCSERLPEDPDPNNTYASKMYQVTNDMGRTLALEWCKTEVRGKTVMRWEWQFGNIYHGTVVAWKPLSEPYEGSIR